MRYELFKRDKIYSFVYIYKEDKNIEIIFYKWKCNVWKFFVERVNS